MLCMPVNLRIDKELNGTIFKPLVKRSNERIILVVDSPHDAAKSTEARDHVGKPFEIAFQLNGTVPRLECEVEHHMNQKSVSK
jgi:hypothetical protein